MAATDTPVRLGGPRYWEGRPVIFRAEPNTGMSGYRYDGEYVRKSTFRGIHIVAETSDDGRREWQVKSGDVWPADEPGAQDR